MNQLVSVVVGVIIAAVSVGILWATRGPVRRLPPRWQLALAVVAWIIEFFVLSVALVLIVGAEAVAGSVTDPSLFKRIAVELGSALPVVV